MCCLRLGGGYYNCINFRPGSEGVYPWEFEKGRQSLTVSVNGPLIVDDVHVVIRAAVDAWPHGRGARREPNSQVGPSCACSRTGASRAPLDQESPGSSPGGATESPVGTSCAAGLFIVHLARTGGKRGALLSVPDPLPGKSRRASGPAPHRGSLGRKRSSYPA